MGGGTYVQMLLRLSVIKPLAIFVFEFKYSSYRYKSLLQHCTYNITSHIIGAYLSKLNVFTTKFWGNYDWHKRILFLFTKYLAMIKLQHNMSYSGIISILYIEWMIDYNINWRSFILMIDRLKVFTLPVILSTHRKTDSSFIPNWELCGCVHNPCIGTEQRT